MADESIITKVQLQRTQIDEVGIIQQPGRPGKTEIDGALQRVERIVGPAQSRQNQSRVVEDERFVRCRGRCRFGQAHGHGGRFSGHGNGLQEQGAGFLQVEVGSTIDGDRSSPPRFRGFLLAGPPAAVSWPS